MPNLPDIPGRGLVSGTSRRARVVATGAGLGVIAVGGYVVRKLVRRGADEGGATADPIAETPTAPPGAKAKEPKADKPKEPKDEKPKPPKPPKAEKPKRAKDEEPKPPKAEPPKPLDRGSVAEPGDISGDEEPHHALNAPVGDPDPTEWPDPFEKRDDPRDPPDPDHEPFGAEPHPQAGAESTSEPHPAEDPEAGDRAKPPNRENLDQ
jgi:hypothetical protein